MSDYDEYDDSGPGIPAAELDIVYNKLYNAYPLHTNVKENSHPTILSMYTATTGELSPRIWKKLPFELVQEVLDHYIDDLLVDYFASEKDFYTRMLLITQVVDLWTKYRYLPLFRR